MSDGYDSWWRVGVAEVSESETVQKCYEEAKEIILKHENILHKCAELLLQKEKITREEFEGLFEEKSENLF